MYSSYAVVYGVHLILVVEAGWELYGEDGYIVARLHSKFIARQIRDIPVASVIFWHEYIVMMRIQQLSHSGKVAP